MAANKFAIKGTSNGLALVIQVGGKKYPFSAATYAPDTNAPGHFYQWLDLETHQHIGDFYYTSTIHRAASPKKVFLGIVWNEVFYEIDSSQTTEKMVKNAPPGTFSDLGSLVL